MALTDLIYWMDEYTRPDILWYAKRLSANDTHATGGHQAGPHIPKEFLFRVFPSLQRKEKNPDKLFDLVVDSHTENKEVRAVWYNNKFHDPNGTRDEARITKFGGAKSALLNPDNTGALVVFAFVLDGTNESNECHVWLCVDGTQEDLVEERIGSVEPGVSAIWSLSEGRHDFKTEVRRTCHLEPGEIPSTWLEKFPTGEEIIIKSVEIRGASGLKPDVRLITRRMCEYEVFQGVEKAFWLPRVSQPFSNIEKFISVAQSILQSRKSRSGHSLELHTRQIFIEEGLRNNTEFTHKPIIENGKRPDFLFPSQSAYENLHYPQNELRMLAVKTTCKDRWRQVLNEASRIKIKHLLTLQEGVSENQFREMAESGVRLVVPATLHNKYPESIRSELISLEDFIGEIRCLSHENKD